MTLERRQTGMAMNKRTHPLSEPCTLGSCKSIDFFFF